MSWGLRCALSCVSGDVGAEAIYIWTISMLWVRIHSVTVYISYIII
jgi:hypothetical protein